MVIKSTNSSKSRDWEAGVPESSVSQVRRPALSVVKTKLSEAPSAEGQVYVTPFKVVVPEIEAVPPTSNLVLTAPPALTPNRLVSEVKVAPPIVVVASVMVKVKPAEAMEVLASNVIVSSIWPKSKESEATVRVGVEVKVRKPPRPARTVAPAPADSSQIKRRSALGSVKVAPVPPAPRAISVALQVPVVISPVSGVMTRPL